MPTLNKFFGVETARELVDEGTQASLLAANNVLAHAPDLNDFVAGMKLLLAEKGVATVEFPHLMRLMEGNQFDTIYQEHYCYFSFVTLQRIFAHHGLMLFDKDFILCLGWKAQLFKEYFLVRRQLHFPFNDNWNSGAIVVGYFADLVFLAAWLVLGFLAFSSR